MIFSEGLSFIYRMGLIGFFVSQSRSTGEINGRTFWSGFGLGVGFGVKDMIHATTNAVKQKAINSLVTTGREKINEINKMDFDPYELREKSNNLGEREAKETDINTKNSLLMAKASIDNILAVKTGSKLILENPQKYIEDIKNDMSLSQNEADYFIEKINQLVADNDPKVQKMNRS